MQTKVAAHFRLVGFGRIKAFKLDKKPTAEAFIQKNERFGLFRSEQSQSFRSGALNTPVLDFLN